MHFEYDRSKSLANHAKHGVDFDDAQLLWQDEDHLVIDARSNGEPRLALLGMLGDRVWTAIFTMRSDKVRLISVRRARDKERELYENNLLR